MNEAPTVQATAIKKMSYRDAQERYHIGYTRWKRIQDGREDHFAPHRGGRPLSLEIAQKILQSVNEMPHWNTAIRATQLSVRLETLQKFLTDRGLSRLNQRLEYAGFKVETPEPLRAARQRRILATYPGAYTAIDFKTFGILRRDNHQTETRISGCVVVDHFTGFATVLLDQQQTTSLAIDTIESHISAAPFTPRGILLSDNGSPFLAEEFIGYCQKRGFIQRTTRYNHPWSNGKVEALNKVLKYQCFPAICAGHVDSIETMQRLVDTWMMYYNSSRAHSGWINKGLPPLVLYSLWERTKGTRLEKLTLMGLIKEADIENLRAMGDLEGRGSNKLQDKHGTPLALVIEKPDCTFVQVPDGMSGLPLSVERVEKNFRPSK